ncbi:hypothetical protein KC332_g13930 [Hortaea werneckii]|uniref:Uncharacterized protein n=1 Tax=Hortaea werneckii TaxID=91943 RepID=A0A3M7I5I5_HORWE|nr:hypothetical protein KC358_g13992 [Hortaea werneckii]KAI6807635.1 hypothetical protein KC350_g13682 [Hortaea werneckii]KAI6908165.1 hypothetical protein KC348_g13947 [Hortaea werneckii]KAI6925113.1 hypothetical protein KC341_g13645 [Hortaea werneckii]KAI6958697.1 hypothetical protein KC321_g13865 [Hortaea werneckii]
MASTQQQRPLLERLQRADDPAFAFKVGGVDMRPTMEKEQVHDETTQASSSSGSDFSNLSALENETDEFGQKLLQYQRDLQRIRHAMAPGQQAFRKARPRQTLGQRLAQHTTQEGEQGGQKHERSGSNGSEGSNPPLNVPREWGRRARKDPHWLRRMRDAEDSQLPAMNEARPRTDRKVEEDTIIPHVRTENDVALGQNDVMPSIENTPPSMRRHRRLSSPSSMHHMNTTLDTGLETDDHDFSSASFLASTPAVNRRDRRIDELAKHDVDFIERRGLSKRTVAHSHQQATTQEAEAVRPVTAPQQGDTTNVPRRRRSLMANKENVAPGPANSAQYKGAETIGLANRNAQRPEHRRGDSYGLLKQLARVSSMSPSPGKDKAGRDLLEKRPRSQPNVEQEPLSAKSVNSDYIAGDKPPSIRQKPEHVYPTPEAEPPGEDKDYRHQEARQDKDLDVTPAPQKGPEDAKTPVVTGAWVETPGQRKSSQSRPEGKYSAEARAPAPSTEAMDLKGEERQTDGSKRTFSEPARAKSALEDILKEAREQADGQFGDTTIRSLENIIDPDLGPSDTGLSLDIEKMAQEVTAAVNAEQQPMSQAEKDRRQETLAIEAMNKHLRAARTSIKDANKGLRWVENRFENAQDRPSTSAEPSTATSSAPKLGKHGLTTCKVCGGTYYGSVWRALWIEFRSCFYTFPTPNSWTIQFTWLGLLSLSLLIWYAIESALCWQYCHKLYATTMVGFGVDYDAPRFPFVLPTLVFRPWKPLWLPVAEYLQWCAECIVNWLYGDSAVNADPPMARKARPVTAFRNSFTNADGYGAWRAPTTAVAAVASSATKRVVGSLVDAVDEVGSMWDDEVF